MPEKKMGNRGSKSVVCKNAIVKEQRAYGSWCIKLMHLRCALTGFERNYQVKNHSKLIIQRRLYSYHHNSKNEPVKAQPENKISGFTGCESFEDKNLVLPNKHTQPIEPWFITGFADAEGCFVIIVRKAPKNNLGWQNLFNPTLEGLVI